MLYAPKIFVQLNIKVIKHGRDGSLLADELELIASH